ncbi:unnamed protein product [Trichobilharzia regenti]|uniref:Ribonuclease P protein component 4 n=1 Tax=Trichobilharzia regenti TaxID=157069 RepID=A0A183W599_TRIRE|nr:unnamed protein product [Trichobilharzia regenti]VDQ03433.1 unnamed protein product [Trichobilharzia regenti]
MGKRKPLNNHSPSTFSPVHHHMNLLCQQMFLYANCQSRMDASFTKQLCLLTSKNLITLSQKSQTRLSLAIRRSLCTKCSIPLHMSGKVRMRRRSIHVHCSLCNHKQIIDCPYDQWCSKYVESVLPDSSCDKLLEEYNNE